MFSLKDAVAAANELNVTFDSFSIKDFLTGLNVEIEHGSQNALTNVTNDDLILTAKIALAHLMEFPNYYNEEYGIIAWEEYLKNKTKN